MSPIIEEDIRMQSVVRLRDNTGCIGSGVLYSEDCLGDRIYLLTAAHCLYVDKDNYDTLRCCIYVDIFSPQEKCYKEVLINNIVDCCLWQPDKYNDVAVFVLNKYEVQKINTQLPKIEIVCHNTDINNILVLGFPRANQHERVLPTPAIWVDNMLAEKQFYLKTDADIIEDYAQGYSGGGLFLQTNNGIFLLGLFVRFQMEERGRYIYGQYLNQINELLFEKQLPIIHFGYIGDGGLTRWKVEQQIKSAVSNLGPNFNPNLRIRTKVHDAIDAVARNNNYRKILFDAFDEWFNDLYISYSDESSPVCKIESKYNELKSRANDICNINISVDVKYDFSELKRQLDNVKEEANRLIQQYSIELKKLSQEIGENNKQTNEYLISRLYSIDNHCSRFSNLENRCLIELSNNPVVIIEGEAGCGKSHLLGDVATSRMEEGYPSLLILGRDVNPSDDIESNIVKIGGFDCSFDDLATSMNRIGIEQNNRFLILIDAINETPRNHYWREKLAGFISKIHNYPAIGLIITVRSTYIKEEVPSQYLQSSPEVTLLKHYGFRGNELDVIPKFCQYYGIATPTLPVLSPEYSNPLLLTISCTIAKYSQNKSFIAAHNGIGDLFTEYRKMMDDKYNDKRDGLYDGLKVVSKSIQIIVDYMLKNNVDQIEYSKCRRLILEEFGSCPLLLNDLIADCILSKVNDYGRDENTFYVRFCYQRLFDYYLTDYILSDCDNREKLLAKFSNKDFKQLFYDNYNFYGMLEQLAVQLPEKYDLEFFEVIDFNYKRLFVEPTQLLMESLFWRSAEHINKEQILHFLQKYNKNYYEWLNTCVLLAAFPNHPFNSDYFTHIMKKMDLSHREMVLQPFLLDYYYFTDSNDQNQFIKRLLNWTWSDEVVSLQDEVARLTGQMLAWMLCSTINCLRDSVTKALVNLLQYHPKSLLEILRGFEDVDDIYIQERLYAVAYGCTLRFKIDSDIREVGKYVYERILKKGNPPRHILWRDYACNTVEYAVLKGGLDCVNMALVLPPYNEQMPNMPSFEDVEKYKLSCDDKDSEPYALAQNYIISSLIDGLADFGTKIVDGRVDGFVYWSFKIENEYQTFKKGLYGSKRFLIDIYERTAITRFREEKSKNENDFFRSSLSDFQIKIISMLPSIKEKIIKHFGVPLANKVFDVYVPNHEKITAHYFRRLHNTWPIRYWIVQRVFELGYDRNLHGAYDIRVKKLEGYNRHSDIEKGKVERIGKKYEWIGLYEVLGCLADNYMIKCPWNTSQVMVYDGAWENFLRDINPTCITRVPEYQKEEKYSWHEYDACSHWNLEGNIWLDTNVDVIDVNNYILRKDDNHNEWFTIHDYRNCYEPKRLGTAKWSSNRYHSIYIDAYIIYTRDKMRLIQKSDGVNFGEEQCLFPKDLNFHHIAREKYWSRGAAVEEKYYKNGWEELFYNSQVKAKLLCENFCGNIEDDHSGTISNCYMPTKELMKLMNLHYDIVDGCFDNDNGKMVATYNPSRPKHFLMSKNELLDVLQENGWDIVWIVSIEKMYSMFGDLRPSYMTMLSGLFYLNENNNIEGTIKLFKR